MKTISYRGYEASVERCNGALYVKILNIDDLLIAECESETDAPGTLADLINAYLNDLSELAS